MTRWNNAGARRSKRVGSTGIRCAPATATLKASGLRWLSVMLLAPIPWTGRVWALPFLTVLAPSERYARQYRRRHKKLTDWALQVLLQVARWLPDRRIVAVADSSYAVIDLLNAVRHRLCVIARLRLDARLFEPPPQHRPKVGRPRVLGRRLPNLSEQLTSRDTRWHRLQITGWYGCTERQVEIVSGTAIWSHPGHHVPIRYVLVRDCKNEVRPQAFLCTDLTANPLDILRWFTRRWCTEVTFAEARRHLGVETQRQWSDRAIARTTPALLGLFSLVALWADQHCTAQIASPRQASWYAKPLPTFADALAAVRHTLWQSIISNTSPNASDTVKMSRAVLNRLTELACYPA